MLCSYRAKDRAEFLDIVGRTIVRPGSCDDDGLAPGEDPKFTHRVLGDLLVVHPDGSADLEVPAISRPDAKPRTLERVPQAKGPVPEPGTWKYFEA